MFLLLVILFLEQFLVISSQYTPKICNISIPIGVWLKNEENPEHCNIIQGHFILDKTANTLARQIFSVFSNLTKIEGCIYVKGYTGSRNLSFFSKLEDVHCNEEEAIRYNLTNVIYVLAPKLKTMGFNSLKNVTGPGEIYLSYEKEQQNNMGIPDGEQCFSKEEIIFLSYHSQFRRKMYPNCETTDPCYRLDAQKQEYFLPDIPDNCTVFAGLLCLLGPYQQDDKIVQKFQNLTLLIGQLQVMGTMLDRLDTIFPKLEVVYPYRIPNLEYAVTETSVFRCMGSWLDYDPVASQYVHVGLNRFLSDISLPSLQPIRPIDVSLPIYDDFMPNGFKKTLYLPDTVQDHCSFFPQFNRSECRAFRGLDKYPDTSTGDTGLDITWLLIMITAITGIILSIRTMILLKFSDVTECLPYSRYLIILVLATITLSALENCLFYQKPFNAVALLEQDINQIDHISSQILSEFSSIYLIQPFITSIMSLLAAARHVCLLLVVVCYLDTVVYYRTHSVRISKLLCLFVIISAIILCLYFNSQFHVAIRGRRPSYSKEPRHIVYMPFVMNTEFKEIFEEYVPATQFVQYDDDLLTVFRTNLYWIENIPMDIWGNSFPSFCFVCDIIMIITVIIFYCLRRFKFGSSQYLFSILILLYIQLSINRIRYYLLTEILVEDYCRRAISRDHVIYSLYNCYTSYEDNLYPETDPTGSKVSGYMAAIMDENLWNFLKWLLEKLPYLCYPIVSFFCWRFARYHSYLGPALRFRIIKEKKKNAPASRMESVMDYSEQPEQDA